MAQIELFGISEQLPVNPHSYWILLPTTCHLEAAGQQIMLSEAASHSRGRVNSIRVAAWAMMVRNRPVSD